MSAEYVVMLVDEPGEEEDIEGCAAQVFMRFTQEPTPEFLAKVAKSNPGKRVYCLMGASTWYAGDSNVSQMNNISTMPLLPDQILCEAVDELETVVVLGYDREGDEYFASNISDGPEVVWLLERSKIALLAVTAEDLIVS